MGRNGPPVQHFSLILIFISHISQHMSFGWSFCDKENVSWNMYSCDTSSVSHFIKAHSRLLFIVIRTVFL
jgi:hypothetical protein